MRFLKQALCIGKYFISCGRGKTRSSSNKIRHFQLISKKMLTTMCFLRPRWTTPNIMTFMKVETYISFIAKMCVHKHALNSCKWNGTFPLESNYLRESAVFKIRKAQKKIKFRKCLIFQNVLFTHRGRLMWN